MTVEIRRASPEEAPLLSELAFRSKGHWGDDPEFLETCRADLSLSPEEVESSSVYVSLDSGGDVTGFYRLVPQDNSLAVLDSLFIEPAATGQGVGRRLWEHAVDMARRLGFAALEFQSDPHAEGFYLAMGAERCGESESTVTPGRMLPLMCYSLKQ